MSPQFLQWCCNTNMESSLKVTKYITQILRKGNKGAYLSACNGELLLALFALSSLIIFKPGVALTGAKTIWDMASLDFK